MYLLLWFSLISRNLFFLPRSTSLAFSPFSFSQLLFRSLSVDFFILLLVFFFLIRRSGICSLSLPSFFSVFLSLSLSLSLPKFPFLSSFYRSLSIPFFRPIFVHDQPSSFFLSLLFPLLFSRNFAFFRLNFRLNLFQFLPLSLLSLSIFVCILS